VAATAVTGCIIQSCSVNLPMLMVGRFIAGLGIGMEQIATSTYASEMAPPKVCVRHNNTLVEIWLIEIF
jgi:MFS family permease